MLGDLRLTGMPDKQLTRVLRDRIGFIFQSFNLLPILTAEQNILLPLDLAGRKPDQQWYRSVAQASEITERLRHRPTELSGGQRHPRLPAGGPAAGLGREHGRRIGRIRPGFALVLLLSGFGLLFAGAFSASPGMAVPGALLAALGVLLFTPSLIPGPRLFGTVLRVFGPSGVLATATPCATRPGRPRRAPP